MLGEGSGALVLESEEHARRRGTRPRAVLRGYGACSSGHSLVAPDPTGRDICRAATRALSGIALEEVGWVKAHGTGTRLGDAAEIRGLAALFGARLATVPIAGLKPLFGHCLGASGAVEAVAAVLAMERGMVPATLGTRDVDPELPSCDVALAPRTVAARAALLLSQGFGGRSMALVIGRPSA